jgi:type II secretory pathway pseudopilin PulG
MLNDPTIERVGLLVLGWLLGLLGPVIVDSVKRRRENKLGRDAIRVELGQLRTRLATAVYNVENHLGTLTKEKTKWTLDNLPAEKDDKIRSGLEASLTWTDEMFARVRAHFAATGNMTLRLQKYGTPLLDARVSALWSFDTEAQRNLLEIKSVLGFLDDAVDQAQYFNELTFKEMSSENHEIAVDSARSYITLYAERGTRAVELINQFL